MKVSKTWVVLGVAGVIGLLAAFAANRYISEQIEEVEARDRNKKMVKVVVAKAEMARGEKLTPDTVAVREVPEEYAHSGAVLPEQFDRVENQAVAYNVKGGEAILWSQLEGQRSPTFSARVATGRRALSVPVDEISSISGMLEPGDLIDLIVTLDHNGKKVTFPLIQSVTVLAAGQRVDTDPANGEKRTYSTITLDTTPDDARRVIIAREAGKITALMRNPQDRTPMSNAKGDMSALLGIERINAESTVPVIYGGRRLDGIPKLGAAASSEQPAKTDVQPEPPASPPAARQASETARPEFALSSPNTR